MLLLVYIGRLYIALEGVGISIGLGWDISGRAQ